MKNTIDHVVVIGGFMLHGAPREEQAALAAALTAQTGCAQVHFLVPAGHGDDVQREVASLDDASERIAQQLAGLTGKIYLVGYSLGGVLALMQATKLGERCAGVTLVSSFVRTPMRIRAIARLGLALAPLFGSYYPTVCGAMAKAFFNPTWVCEGFAATNPKTVLSWLKILADIDIRQMLSGIQANVHVIGVRLDPVIPDACRRETLTHLPKATTTVISGIAHAVLPGDHKVVAEELVGGKLMMEAA